MINIAINVLYFLIGLIILCGIVYLAIWVIEQFIMAIPEPVKKGVWVIVLLLALIALLTVIAGGSFPKIFHGWLAGSALVAIPTETAGYLHRLLT